MSQKNTDVPLDVRRSARIAQCEPRPPDWFLDFDWAAWEKRMRKRKVARIPPKTTTTTKPARRITNSVDMFDSSEAFSQALPPNQSAVRAVEYVDVATLPGGWAPPTNKKLEFPLKQPAEVDIAVKEATQPANQKLHRRSTKNIAKPSSQITTHSVEQRDSNVQVPVSNDSGISSNVSQGNGKRKSMKKHCAKDFPPGRFTSEQPEKRRRLTKKAPPIDAGSHSVPPARASAAPLRIVRYYDHTPFYGNLTASGSNAHPAGCSNILPANYPPHFQNQRPFDPNRTIEMALAAADAQLQLRGGQGQGVAPHAAGGGQEEGAARPLLSTPDMDYDDQLSTSTPSLSASVRGLFGTDSIREILKTDRVLYRLGEHHVQALALALQLDVEYLSNVLDRISILKSEVLNHLLQNTRQPAEELTQDTPLSASPTSSHIESSPPPTTATWASGARRLFPSQRDMQ